MLQLANLNERIRSLMLDEVDHDVDHGKFFVSPRLSNTGQQNYLTLLREAIGAHDEVWLADELQQLGRMRTTEQRRKPKGGYTVAKIPANAAAGLAESEFNRYYVRAVCRLALEEGFGEVEVY